jgi:RNA polymerase sigma-70 factor (ECF subfamily)
VTPDPGSGSGDVLLRLLAACRSRDEEAVRATLSSDVTVVVDSGGHADEPQPRAHGIDEAARLLLRIFVLTPAVSISEQSVNGRPGLVVRRADRVVGVVSASVASHTIGAAWIVVNPDKLRHWNAAGE